MKLPKNFGGAGLGGLMKQAQEAMEKAQALEQQLEAERLEVVKGPIKGIFNGKGQMEKISLDPSVVDPNDIEMLEDLIVSFARDGFTQAAEQKARKVQELMPGMPNLPGM